eukprot:9588981-Lingulodinium_polyedra.AAC.1
MPRGRRHVMAQVDCHARGLVGVLATHPSRVKHLVMRGVPPEGPVTECPALSAHHEHGIRSR